MAGLIYCFMGCYDEPLSIVVALHVACTISSHPFSGCSYKVGTQTPTLQVEPPPCLFTQVPHQLEDQAALETPICALPVTTKATYMVQTLG